jgi:DNA-binding transcriptional regulator YiaG
MNTLLESKVSRLARLRRLTSEGEARRLRLRSQASLSEIAAEVGVTPSCILRWEMADRRPSGERALRYLAILEELDELSGR